MIHNFAGFAVILSLPLALLSLPSQAAPRADKMRTVEGRKTGAYLKDGLYTGGDRAINDVEIQDIRRGPNAGFERLVIQLGEPRNTDSVAVERPPYYQVAVSTDESRAVITVFGRPRLGFDPRSVQAALKKSPHLAGVELLPKFEEDQWTFSVGLKGNGGVEVFELRQPTRIVLDIKTAGPVASLTSVAPTPSKKGAKKSPPPEAPVEVIETTTDSTGDDHSSH
jgi:hypothetical protein